MHDWPFGGDIYLIEEIFELINKFNIKTIIETGTFHGRTAQLMSAMCNKVFTVEIDEKIYEEANFLNNYSNVTRVLGDSPKVLDSWLKNNLIEFPALFFLDAHWKENWPLLDELKVLAEHKVSNSVIVIHDFYTTVDELGYDTYDKVRLDYDYVKESIKNIYGNFGYDYDYNYKATGDKRGVIFIYPIK